MKMPAARQSFQRSVLVAHEAKHNKWQRAFGPIIPPGTTPGDDEPDDGVSDGSQTTPTGIIPPTTSSSVADTVHRTTVTTVVPAPSSTSTTPTTSSTSSTSSTSTTVSSTSLTTSTSRSSTTSSTVPISTHTSSSVAVGKTNTVFKTTFSSSSSFPTNSAVNSSSSANSSSSSGVSTTGIVGIAAASIVGIAVVTGLIMFFIRRVKNRDNDVDDLRRQSVALGDENASLHRGNSNGYGARPRPPTMIERHYANIAPPGPTCAPSFAGIRPGEVMPSNGIAPSLPPNAQVQQAFFNNPMGQTPVGSPVSVAPYGSAYDDQGRLVRTPSNSAASALSRSKSVQDPFHDAQPSSQEDADYTDLHRASVTPFQAAQYMAISKELKIPPPVPTLPSAALDKSDVPSAPIPESPFEDPQDRTRQMHNPASRKDGVTQQAPEYQHHSYVTFATDSRIASLPPMLSPQQSANLVSPHEEMNFPVSPSPLRSEFNLGSTNGSPLPSPVITAFAGQGPAVNSGSPLRHAVNATDEEQRNSGLSKPQMKRPLSAYDDEDAYGGF